MDKLIDSVLFAVRLEETLLMEMMFPVVHSIAKLVSKFKPGRESQVLIFFLSVMCLTH